MIGPRLAGEFPHVDIPVPIDPEGKALVERLTTDFKAHRQLKIKHAVAMLRVGVEPYKRPPAEEVARRRKAGKAQRQARKKHR